MEFETIQPEFVNYIGVPVMDERISPVQTVEREADQAIIDLSLSSSFHFWMPSTDLLLLMVAGHLLYLVSSFLIRKSIKRSLSSGNLKILSFFYLIFTFFMNEFLADSISTDHLIVRTDNILYSREQILSTNKEFCSFENGVEFDFVKRVSLFF